MDGASVARRVQGNAPRICWQHTHLTPRTTYPSACLVTRSRSQADMVLRKRLHTWLCCPAHSRRPYRSYTEILFERSSTWFSNTEKPMNELVGKSSTGLIPDYMGGPGSRPCHIWFGGHGPQQSAPHLRPAPPKHLLFRQRHLMPPAESGPWHSKRPKGRISLGAVELRSYRLKDPDSGQ